MSARKFPNGYYWESKEISKLLVLVADASTRGKVDWNLISNRLHTYSGIERTASACKLRWEKVQRERKAKILSRKNFMNITPVPAEETNVVKEPENVEHKVEYGTFRIGDEIKVTYKKGVSFTVTVNV